MKGKTIAMALLAVLFASAAATFLHGQATAEITDTVTDSSGATVPTARVTAIHEDTGTQSVATSNDADHYAIPFLRPGPYRLDVQKDGFQTLVRPAVTLQVAQGVKIDFQLQIGGITDRITVGATAPLLDTTTNVIGAVVSRDKVENLPLKGRNASAFLELTPGVRLHRSTLNQPVVESHWQFFSI